MGPKEVKKGPESFKEPNFWAASSFRHSRKHWESAFGKLLAETKLTIRTLHHLVESLWFVIAEKVRVEPSEVLEYANLSLILLNFRYQYPHCDYLSELELDETNFTPVFSSPTESLLYYFSFHHVRYVPRRIRGKLRALPASGGTLCSCVFSWSVCIWIWCSWTHDKTKLRKRNVYVLEARREESFR